MSAKRSLQPIWLLLISPSLACGAAVANDAPKAATPRLAQHESTPPQPSSDLDQIQHLHREIRDWNHELGLVEEFANCSVDPPPVPCPPPAPDLSCIPPAEVPETCQGTCATGDNICENAAEICEHAGDAEGNAWAADKCTSAKASCREVKRKCCRCGTGEPPPPRPLIL